MAARSGMARYALPPLWGALFAAYQIVRPYPVSEAGIEGAAAVGSAAWTASHTAAMLAFIVLALWVPMVVCRWGPRYAWLVPLAVVAIGLVLPFYGAETFGLGAIARRAAATGDWSLLNSFGDVRYAGTPVLMFAVGLLALAVLSAGLAVGWWRHERPRWVVLPATIALLAFLPQFFTSSEIRMLHGLTLLAGGVLLAVSLRRAPSGASRSEPGSRQGSGDRSTPGVAA